MKKYLDFKAGRAGSGKVNLATGAAHFTHETTKSASAVLPITVSHIYSSQTAFNPNTAATYGKGFKLNLQQKLTHHKTDDTKWKLVDGSGEEHKFKERFYYKSGDEKIYVPPAGIKIDLDGKMTYGDDEKEVFKTVRTKSGLELETELKKAISGSELLETRHEEIIKLEDEIKNCKMAKTQIEIEKDSFINEILTGHYYNLTMPKQIELNKMQDSYRNHTKKEDTLNTGRIRAMFNGIEEVFMGYDDRWYKQRPNVTIPPDEIVGLDPNHWEDIGLPAGNSWNNENITFDYNSAETRFAYKQFPARLAEHLALEQSYKGYDISNPNADQELNQGVIYFRERFNDLCDRITQDITDKNAELEKLNLDYQIESVTAKKHTMQLQKQLLKIKAEVENASFENLDKQQEVDLAADLFAKYAKLYDIKLKNAEHMLAKMTDRMPATFVIDKDGTVLGFNKDGNLTMLSDGGSNQVAIIYEDGLIKTLIDTEKNETSFNYKNNLLAEITDIKGRKTKFEYDGNLLTKVIYPGGGQSEFAYHDGKLIKVLNSAKLGIKLEYDSSRIIKIAETSLLKKLDGSGAKQSETERQNNAIQIVYSNDSTSVIDGKNNPQTEYFFDSARKLVAEKHPKKTVVYDINDTYAFTWQTDEQIDLAAVLAANGTRTHESVSALSGSWSYAVLNDNRDKTAEYVKEKSQLTERHFTYDDNNNLIKETAATNGKEFWREFDYNKNNKLIRTVDSAGMVKENIFDKDGKKVKEQTYHFSNPSAKFVSEQQDEDSSPSAQNDKNKVTRGYNPHTDELTAISSCAGAEPNSTTFAYTADFLTQLKSGNTEFNYSYDHFGRRTSINDYVKYEYNTVDGNNSTKAIYANGEGYETIANKEGKVLQVNYIKNSSWVKFITNTYDEENRLKTTTDHTTGETKEFTYDTEGNIINQTGLVAVEAAFDINGNMQNCRIAAADKEHEYSYNYDDDGSITSTTLPTGESESVTNDKLGRAVKYKTAIGTQELVYAQNGEKTSNLIASETFRPLCHSEQSEESPKFSKVRYTYDNNGNITHIYEAGQLVCRYTYDELNRLISEDNAKLGRTYTYEYDVEGNLLYKNKYDFDLADNLTNGKLISYNYNKEGLLTDFNGEKCEYDNLGNPTLYRGAIFNWSHVRNLASIAIPACHSEAGGTPDVRISFNYNANGLRTNKTCGNEVTNYHWLDGKLLAEVRSLKSSDNLHCGDIFSQSYVYAPVQTHRIDYLYGVDGISGFTLCHSEQSEESHYYYRKNILGDVVAIYKHVQCHSEEGSPDVRISLVAEYTYDAWGNHLVTTDIDGIGTLNPIRYRGYYYDVETGLYYLKSRYYDPETARFINMDSIDMLDETKAQINGLNLYMYCGNNPITNIDESGFCFFCRLWKAIKKAVVKIALTIVSAIITVAGGVLFAMGLTGVGLTLMGAGIGSAIGAWTSDNAIAGWAIGGLVGAAVGAAVGFGIPKLFELAKLGTTLLKTSFTFMGVSLTGAQLAVGTMFAGSTLLFIDSLDDFKLSKFLYDNTEGLFAAGSQSSLYGKLLTGFLRAIGFIGSKVD